jgi:hypothetical protein
MNRGPLRGSRPEASRTTAITDARLRREFPHRQPGCLEPLENLTGFIGTPPQSQE